MPSGKSGNVVCLISEGRQLRNLNFEEDEVLKIIFDHVFEIYAKTWSRIPTFAYMRRRSSLTMGDLGNSFFCLRRSRQARFYCLEHKVVFAFVLFAPDMIA